MDIGSELWPFGLRMTGFVPAIFRVMFKKVLNFNLFLEIYER